MAGASAFYTRDGDRYAATPSTAGPWDPALQHGGPAAALLGSRIERAAARADARVAHFALEVLGPVPVSPLEVTTDLVRASGPSSRRAEPTHAAMLASRSLAEGAAVEDEGESSTAGGVGVTK